MTLGPTIRRPTGPCLETLARNCEDAIAVWDAAGDCVLWNRAAERMFGRAECDAVGRPMHDIVPVGNPVNVDECVAATLAGEIVPECERPFRLPDGSTGVLRARRSTLRDPEGVVIGGIAVFHDLTTLRTAESDRAASDATRRAVFDAALDAIVVVGADGRYVDANPAACQLLGRTREDVLSHRVGDFSAPGHDGTSSFRAAIATAAGRGDHRIARPDGTERDVEFEARADFVPGLHLGVFRDVTERLAAERALRESETRFRALFDGIPAPVIVFRWDGAGLFVVEANSTVHGRVGRAVAVGTPASKFLAHRPDLLAQLLRCPRERRSIEAAVDWTSLVDGRPLRFRGFAHFVEPDLVVTYAEDVTAQCTAEAERAAALAAAHEARAAAEAADRRHRALAQHVTELLETERRTLARGLHDELGQELTALRILLETAARHVPDPCAAPLAEAERRVSDMLRRVRDLSFALRPPMLDDLGLVAAVLWSAKRFGDATGVRVDFGQVGAERRFASDVEVAAFRIVQEALTNVARHARTADAQVRLWVRDATLFVEVRDAGCGFDSESSLEASASVGIAGMRERAELLEGTVTIESVPGRGTVVTAALPAHEGGAL